MSEVVSGSRLWGSGLNFVSRQFRCHMVGCCGHRIGLLVNVPDCYRGRIALVKSPSVLHEVVREGRQDRQIR
jgi:hypothetical protein